VELEGIRGVGEHDPPLIDPCLERGIGFVQVRLYRNCLHRLQPGNIGACCSNLFALQFFNLGPREGRYQVVAGNGAVAR